MTSTPEPFGHPLPIRWVVPIDKPPSGSGRASITDGVVVFEHALQGGMTALRMSDGAQVWSRDSGPIAALGSGGLVTHLWCQPTTMLGLSVADGAVRWQRELDQEVRAVYEGNPRRSPHITLDGAAWVHVLQEFDTHSKVFLRTVDMASGDLGQPVPLFGSGLVAWRGTAYAVSDTMLWRFDGRSVASETLPLGANHVQIAHDGRLMLYRPGPKEHYVVDAGSLEILARFPGVSFAYHHVNQDQLVAIDSRDTFSCRSLSTGTVAWRCTIEGARFRGAWPVGERYLLLVGGDSVIVDLHNGEVVSRTASYADALAIGDDAVVVFVGEQAICISTK